MHLGPSTGCTVGLLDQVLHLLVHLFLRPALDQHLRLDALVGELLGAIFPKSFRTRPAANSRGGWC